MKDETTSVGNSKAPDNLIVQEVIMARRINKWFYVFNIQQYYDGGGWETVNCEETHKDARRSRREYQEGQPEYPVRITNGRDPNPEHPDHQR